MTIANANIFLTTDDSQKITFKNGQVSNLIDYLNGSLQIPYFVIDGTGLNTNINIVMNKDIESLEIIKNELRQQGFDLFETEEEVQVFVVTKK